MDPAQQHHILNAECSKEYCDPEIGNECQSCFDKGIYRNTVSAPIVDNDIDAMIQNDIVISDIGYVFYPEKLNGFLSAHTLRHIADILDAKNAEIFKDLP